MKGVHCQMSVMMTAGSARPGVPSQILGWKPAGEHDVIDQPEIGIKQVPPDQSHNDRRNHDGNNENRPKKGDPLHAFFQQKGQRQAKKELG